MENKIILQPGSPNKPILEKPLVQLPTSRQTPIKTKDIIALEIVTQKMEELQRLIKKEPSTSSPSIGLQLTTLDTHTATSDSSRTSSDNEKEIEHVENQFRDLKVKRLYHPPSTSLTKNWYPRPTPPDLQYEEKNVSN